MICGAPPMLSQSSSMSTSSFAQKVDVGFAFSSMEDFTGRKFKASEHHQVGGNCVVATMGAQIHDARLWSTRCGPSARQIR